jgi:hypothetical protein
MTNSTSKRPGGQDKKIISEKDKSATKGYAGRMAESIRRSLTYMKNLKISPAVHRRLKMEAAALDVNIYDLAAAAITVGMDRPKEIEKLLKQQAEAGTNQEPGPPATR